MVKTLKIFGFLLLTLLTSSHECIHDKVQHDLKIADPEYAMYDTMDGRALQTYQNIRILVDTSSKPEESNVLYLSFFRSFRCEFGLSGLHYEQSYASCHKLPSSCSPSSSQKVQAEGWRLFHIMQRINLDPFNI